jgi:hypothetical protein
VEDARTPAEFVQAAERARDAIRLRNGEARAEQLWEAIGL